MFVLWFIEIYQQHITALLYGVLLCCPVWVITSIWHSESYKTTKHSKNILWVFWFMWLFKCLWSDVVRCKNFDGNGLSWPWPSCSGRQFDRNLFCREQLQSWAVFVSGRSSSINWYHESNFETTPSNHATVEIMRSLIMAHLQRTNCSFLLNYLSRWTCI